MYQFTLFFQLLCIAAAFVLVIVIVKKQPNVAQKYLMIASIAVLVQCIGYFLELTSVDTSAAVVSLKIEYLGICFSPLYFMVFAFYYCRTRLPRWLYSIYLVTSFLILIIVLTNETHHLQFTSQILITDGTFPHFYLEHGPLYFIHIPLIISQGLITLILAISRIIKENKNERKRYYPVIICVLFPLTVMILYHSGFFGRYDATPFGQLVSLFLAVAMVYKYNLFRVVQSAKETLVDHMADALVILDYDRRYMDANNKAKELFPKLDNTVDDEKLDIFNSYFQDFYDESIGEKEYMMSDRYYKCDIRQIYEGKKHKGYALQFSDITDVRNHTLELIEMTNRAEEANRAKSRFLANMSHEIRTPMNTIIGMSEIMLREDLSNAQRTNIESILFSSENLLGIINNILDLSKVEAGKFELELKQYNIESLLYNVCNGCTIKLEGLPVKFELLTNPDIPVGYTGDIQIITQILMNLLGNAVKYCEKGTITLSVDGHFVNVNRQEQDEEQYMLEFIISDTGIGIRPEELDRIFEAYTRTDTEKSKNSIGTGLGLAITKNFVELMNGTISVESVYGEGSSFHVSLPQTVADRRRLGSTSVKMETLQAKREKEYKNYQNTCIFRGAKVLVVDDIKVNLMVTTGLLKPYQMEIDVAGSGAEAIEKIKVNKYDLIFMDHMMPEMDGIETTDIIRKLDDSEKSSVIIIALTANALSGARELFDSHGFNDYLSKPIEIKRLEKVLEKWLAEYREPVEHENTEEHDICEEFRMLEKAGINVTTGIGYTGGKPDAYRFILNGFYDSFAEFDQDLLTIAKQNVQGFSIFIHGLKGALASIGAESLADLAKKIEMAARDGGIEYIEGILPEFEERFRQIISGIGEYKNNE